ncbi:MAG: hypothetical protein PHR87_06800 [Sulfurospirillaceae bacterium]|nr:hypothetical protein [Sulfurospirillaceae bacterium]
MFKRLFFVTLILALFSTMVFAETSTVSATPKKVVHKQTKHVVAKKATSKHVASKKTKKQTLAQSKKKHTVKKVTKKA